MSVIRKQKRSRRKSYRKKSYRKRSYRKNSRKRSTHIKRESTLQCTSTANIRSCFINNREPRPRHCGLSSPRVFIKQALHYVKESKEQIVQLCRTNFLQSDFTFGEFFNKVIKEISTTYDLVAFLNHFRTQYVSTQFTEDRSRSIIKQVDELQSTLNHYIDETKHLLKDATYIKLLSNINESALNTHFYLSPQKNKSLPPLFLNNTLNFPRFIT